MKLYDDIKNPVLSWRRAYAISFGINFLAGILRIVFGVFAILTLLDVWFYFQAIVRQTLFLVFSGFLLYESLKTAKELFYHLKLENFSSRLSVKAPSLSKYIGPAINFILMPGYKSKDASDAFLREHILQTAEKIKKIKNIKFSPFDDKKFKAKLIGALCGALCLGGLWIINPLSAQRMIFPFSGDEFENIVTISPGNKIIVENKSVSIKISWKKKINIVPVLQIKEKDSGWISVNWDNQKLSNCEYKILRLKNDLRYRFKYRSMKSREYRLGVRKYPQIKDINFILKRPAYLRAPKSVYSYIPSQLQVLEGSNILIKASSAKRASKIILHAKSASNDRKINFLKDKKGNFQITWKAYEDMSLEFEIFADDNLANPKKIFQKLTIVKDLPPIADILSPLFELEMPSGGGIKIVYYAKDDFGLTQVSLRSEIRFQGKVDKRYDALKELRSLETMQGAIAGGNDQQTAQGKNIKEFIGDTYVFFPNFLEDFEAYFYLRVFDDFPVEDKNKRRWTESLPVKVKIKNFYKNHLEALGKLTELKHNFTQMLREEEKAAFNISRGSAAFKTSGFLKRWEKFEKLSEKALSSLNRDPYFNAGLKNEYEMLQEDIAYMSRVRAKKTVKEFKGQAYKKAGDTQKSMASFLKRGLAKMDEILSSQRAKDFEFKAEDWENSLSKIDKALSQASAGKVDDGLWDDLSEIMKTLAREMSSMSKILSSQKYQESFGERRRFQIPINEAASLAAKLQKALKSRNLEAALKAAKALLEEIRKTRQVFSEYSDFVASMQGNDGKIKKLQKIKDLWEELRDAEEETFSKNTVFTDKLISKVNLKRKETLTQLRKSRIKMREISLSSDIKKVEGLKFKFKVSLNKVADISEWRKSLKDNVKALKKVSPGDKSSNIKNFMEELNFSIILSSAIENDARFYDAGDKTFFSGSANSQERITGDAYKLETELDKVKEEFIKFSSKAQKHLSKAIDEMKLAVSALNTYAINKALAHQLKALEELDALGDMINKNMQKQKKMSSAKKSGAQGPKSFGMPAGGGPGKMDKSGVKLPKGSFRPSKEIREKVMESLKESYPQKSKEAILDYLRKISE